MKSLEERIATLRKEYSKLIRLEKIGESTVKRIGFVENTKNISVSRYSNAVDIILRAEDFEMAELLMIPRIAGILNEKWRKEVHGNGVTYHISFNPLKDTRVSISVLVDETALREDECKIIPVNTGRTIHDTRIVSVKVPEVIYVTDCSEGANA